MSHHPRLRAAWIAPLAIFTVFALSACTETEVVTEVITDTVIVTAPLYPPLPDGANSFVGFNNTENETTTCGSCHSSAQAAWSGTAHAGAWDTLQDSGHSQSFCENCHAISQLGNKSQEDGGWTTTMDERYVNVQCESCHGPGQTHIDSPDKTTVPSVLPSLAVDTLNGCGQCHEGTHHPFAEQWKLSKHSQVVGFAASRPECASCHRGQATLLAWGANGNYVEKDSDEPLPVVCGVCHDPHANNYEGQTRFPVDVPDITVHLCARCHNRRTEPDPGSSHGLAPHAPESELLVGNAGWFPPNIPALPGDIVGTHGSAANPSLCTTCHVNMFSVTDPATGDFLFQAVGHTFQGIPCVDADGIPTGADDCEYFGAPGLTERDWQGCTDAGCHGTAQAAQSALFAATGRLSVTQAQAVVNLLALVPQTELDPATGVFTVAKGSIFNVNLTIFPNAIHWDDDLTAVTLTREDATGSSTHNPFLLESLLLGSAAAIIDEYGVGTPSIKRQIEEWTIDFKARAVR